MQTGLTYTATLTVTNAHLALTVGSGELPVLATPALSALMEEAAWKAVAPALEAGSTTVGGEICLTHKRPTACGKTVSATATLTAVEGRKLTFHITASDEKGEIGEASHLRFIVDSARFMAKV